MATAAPLPVRSMDAPTHALNDRYPNAQSRSQEPHDVSNETGVESMRRDPITLSNNGSTQGLSPQPSSTAMATPAFAPTTPGLQMPSSSCCNKPEGEAQRPSPGAFGDTMNRENGYSSPSNMDSGIPIVQQNRAAANPSANPLFSTSHKDQGKVPFQAEFTYEFPHVPYTTIYSIPSTYATSANPLTSEQQAHTMANSQLHPQTVPQLASSGLVGSAAPSADSSHGSALTYDCSCGENCQCVFCAVHPYNAPTRDRVQTLANLLHEEDPSFIPQVGPLSPYGSISHSLEGRGAGMGSGEHHYGTLPLSSATHLSPVAHLGSSGDDFRTIYSESSDNAQQRMVPSSEYMTIAYSYDSGVLDRCMVEHCRCNENCSCFGCFTHAGHDGELLQLE